MILKVQGDSYLFIPKDSVHDSLTGIKSPEDKQKKRQEGVVTMMHLKFTSSINIYSEKMLENIYHMGVSKNGGTPNHPI